MQAITVPVKIDSVPPMDLTELANQSPGFISTAIELHALFDADRQVKEVKPNQTTPKVISGASTPSGKTIDADLRKADKQFVKELTVSLMSAAIAEVTSVRFTPKVSNGKPVPNRAIAIFQFSFAKLPLGVQGTRCDSARLTISDDSGVLWDRMVWVSACEVY